MNRACSMHGRNEIYIYFGKPRGSNYFGDLRVGVGIMLK
jgi:hypothetical protein